MSSIALHLKNALAHPLKTASVLPSSPRLSQNIVDAADLENASTVVEFGPGTGVITEKIIERLAPDATLVAMEINADFAERTRREFPRAEVFNMCASRTVECLQNLGLEGCDRIVSGLPWAVFSDAFQKKLLTAAREALLPGGVFVSFAYTPVHMLPSGRNFRKNLEEIFTRVGRTRMEWLNFPPAFVYRAL